MWSSGVLCWFSQSAKVSHSRTSSQVLGVGRLYVINTYMRTEFYPVSSVLTSHKRTQPSGCFWRSNHLLLEITSASFFCIRGEFPPLLPAFAVWSQILFLLGNPPGVPFSNLFLAFF